MFLQVLMFQASVVLIFALTPFTEGRNITIKDSECVLTDIESRLSVASDIIETARQRIPKDLKQLCKENLGKCPDCKEISDKCPDCKCPDCKQISDKYPDCKKTTCDVKPLDCSDLYGNGERRDGLYVIWPQSRISKGPLSVYCDMESNGGGWTVIQRRGDYNSPKDHFYRDWNAYKTGFGDKLKEFWIGNDDLFALTNQRSYELRVNLTNWEEKSAYAIYHEFWVSEEALSYTLHVDGYSGTAGDSLNENNGIHFSTKDRGIFISSGRRCAGIRRGGWWYPKLPVVDVCGYSSLNGLYLGNSKGNYTGITWTSFGGLYHSLKETVMKIRPVNFETRSAD